MTLSNQSSNNDKVLNLSLSQFYHRTVNHKNFEMYPQVLLCVLYKSPVDIEPLNIDNYLINHNLNSGQNFQKKYLERIYFYTFLPIYGLKFKIQMSTIFVE